MDLRGCWQSGHKKTRSGPVPWWTGPGFVLQLWICFGCSTEAADEFSTVKGVIGVPYNESVTITNQTIYTFKHTVYKNESTGLRVTVDVLPQGNESLLFPILVDVRQMQAVISFEVPLTLRGSNTLDKTLYPYGQVARTLCLAPVEGEGPENRTFSVDVSTLSSQAISYHLTVSHTDSFTLQTNKTFSFTASPSQPQYFKYVFPEDVSIVMVNVSSANNICAVLSIQDIQCPVYDLNTNVKFMGKYQTITRIGAIIVQKNLREKCLSFYVVVLVKPEDEECWGYHTNIIAGNDTVLNGEFRAKEVQVVVSQNNEWDASTRDHGILFCVGIFLSFYLLTFLVGCLETLVRKESATHAATPGEDGSREEKECLEDTPSNKDDKRALLSPDSNQQEFLFVSALSQKPKNTVSKKHHGYIWNLITIAVFYGLPVIQLFTGYYQFLDLTGWQDICYYNSLCAHPLGHLSAFNNVLSNLGYVLLGFLFILIVGKRHLHHRALVEKDKNILDCGIPKHFGLYYTMGIALMMEGVLSGCYHVCPKGTNFQFDTTFMYMIAGLSMLQLYQKRHPDITINAHFAFTFLAAVVLMAVLGKFAERGDQDGDSHGQEGEWVFWSILSLIHILAIFLLTIQLYYTSRPWKQVSATKSGAAADPPSSPDDVGEDMRDVLIEDADEDHHASGGSEKDEPHEDRAEEVNPEQHLFLTQTLDSGILRRVKRCIEECKDTAFIDRMVLLVMGNIVNWCFAVYDVIIKPDEDKHGPVASHMLNIAICNLLLYFIYYIIMKLRSKEFMQGACRDCYKWLKLAIISILTVVAWGFALDFFGRNVSSWKKTPAESRELNKDCYLLDFFDYHDVWHFLSAIALFGTFLVLLIIDDDLETVQQDKIRVF